MIEEELTRYVEMLNEIYHAGLSVRPDDIAFEPFARKAAYGVLNVLAPYLSLSKEDVSYIIRSFEDSQIRKI